MIITFINQMPASGKTSVCIALANRLNDIPGDEGTNVIIFDCDPKLTTFTKYETFVKKYRKPPTNYQVISLPLDDDGLVFKVINEIKDKSGYFLFDMPSLMEEWLCLRVLVSSHLIIVPFQPATGNDGRLKDFIIYLSRLRQYLLDSKIPVRSHFVLTPILMNDEKHLNDGEKSQLNLESFSEMIITPEVGNYANLLEKLNPIDMTDFDKLPFKEFTDKIIEIIDEIDQSGHHPKDKEETTLNNEIQETIENTI